MRECVCLAALQGGQADAGEVVREIQQQAVVTTRGLRDGTSGRRLLLHPERPARGAVQPADAEEGGRGGSPLSPGSLMTAPRPTPCR